MADEPEVPSGQRRQRRRRRAVWRPGEGISRSSEPRSAQPRGAQPRSAEPRGAEPLSAEPRREPEAPVPSAPAAKPPAQTARRAPSRPARSEPVERGLREIVGAGPSQLGPVRAMRARDANRPTDAELAEAEQEVELVRRNWKPPK